MSTDASRTPSEPDLVPAGRLAEDLRTPQAAAAAGIAFAVILTGVVVLLRLASPESSDKAIWITDAGRRRQMTWALALTPYAGIAFLWFIGVIRARLGDREDKLFATAFLGSGLLFVAMLFAAAAGIGALLALYRGPGSLPAYEVRLVSATSTTLLVTFGIRMASVFTLIVTNLGRRNEIVPRWLQVVGFAAGATLLLAPARASWAVLLFPAWVFLLSLQILIDSVKSSRLGSVG